MTTLQKTAICATLAAVVSAGLFEAHPASTLQEKVLALQSQPARNAGMNDSLRQQLDEASGQIASLQAQNEKLRRDAADLARLRGEVTRLREKEAIAANPASESAASWLERTERLKQRVKETPSARIPEFQYLTEKEWLDVARADLNNDEDFRKALSHLRNAAEDLFVRSELQPAMKKFAAANNGQFPASLGQLNPYFDPPVDDSVLQRWQVAPKSAVPNIGVGEELITQVAAVDADYDSRLAIGANGYGSNSGIEAWDAAAPAMEKALTPALKAYQTANNGTDPTDPSQLAPYVTTPEQQQALQYFMKHTPGASASTVRP